MRILIVSHYFPPEPMRVGDLAFGLKELGNEVEVLTGFPSYPSGRLYPGYNVRFFQREAYRGVDVIRVPSYPVYGKSKFKRALNYLSFALSGSILGTLLVDRPDRILVYQNSPVTMAVPALVIKALRGGRLFLWVQDLWPDTLEVLDITHSPWILRSIGLLVRLIYRQCEKVLVQSRGLVRAIVARGVPDDRIEYLPNWAEDIYQVLPYDEEFSRAEGLTGGFNIIFAGNIGIAQNLFLLLDVADKLREYSQIRFVVIGDGSDFEPVRESARKRELQNLVFKGRQPPEKMPKYFAAAEALLVQLRMNPVFEITIPSKLQSYMACGRPIIASLSGSGAQVVSQAGAGIVCQPDDPVALREAILALWGMKKEEREQMGANARKYYERHFDRRLVLGRLQAVLTGA